MTRSHILQTLLYYDIWRYPLSASEVYAFLPVNSITFAECKSLLHDCVGNEFQEAAGYYYVSGHPSSIVEERIRKEHHARNMWRMARLATHVIKRFPFVRAVFVSGDLSKNATGPGSDVDFFIVTEPGRLWIARMLLIIFKKIVLLDSKKYFCLNSFVTSDHLTLDERNVYIAAEVAHLKPTFNSGLFQAYLTANGWIREYFPNFTTALLPRIACNNRRSVLQRILELPFSLIPAHALDSFLLKKMESVWERRYPQFDPVTRKKIFRCTKTESRAYIGNFETTVLTAYRERLEKFGVA